MKSGLPAGGAAIPTLTSVKCIFLGFEIRLGKEVRTRPIQVVTFRSER